MRKTCEQCGNEATVTVCWLLSTVGSAPRVQKCSKASIFCLACIRGLCAPDGAAMPSLLRQRLQGAYTAAIERIHSDSASSGVPVNGGGTQ